LLLTPFLISLTFPLKIKDCPAKGKPTITPCRELESNGGDSKVKTGRGLFFSFF
jgi:hypothetical protein